MAAAIVFAASAPACRAAFGIGEFETVARKADGSAETQAGSHPYSLEIATGFETEAGARRVHDFAVHMPPGLLLNPTMVPECSEADFHTPRISPFEASSSGESCPNSSQVGVLHVNMGGTDRWFGLFNLAHPFGTVAAIGASPFGVPLVFKAKVREADAGLDLVLDEVPQSFDLRAVELSIWGTPWAPAAPPSGPGPPPPPNPSPHNDQRGNCLNEETSGSWGACMVLGSAEATEAMVKSYLTLPPTPCGSPLPFVGEAGSWPGEKASATAVISPLERCNKALVTPKVQLTTNAAAARTGLALNVEVNDGGGILNPRGIARPPIKTAVVSLPEGLTINPSLAAGLGVCGDAEWARETAISEPGSGCPNSSKIGTVVLDGALGLTEQLQGSVYLAQPYSNPFGTLLAVYMVARLPGRGLILKSQGKIEPDPHSGRLVATFDDLPRLLYTHFGLTLREGQRSTLISPAVCGTYGAGLETASWAEPTVFEHSSSLLLVTYGDGGGPCPSGGVPSFSPTLVAGSMAAAAGAYSPFSLRMARGDAEQEITAYSATFPPGLLGRIAGVAACPDSALAVAAGRSGTAEQASPACPAASRIGRTVAGYGVGGTLAWASGGLYLAGPYHGAPLSVVAVNPATIGPFDLGTVIVRQAVRIDRRSAQVSLDPIGSDPIPHILAGIPLHLRYIRVYVDRRDFMVNPTSCNRMRVSSSFGGAGANPFDQADDSQAISTQSYQVLGCRSLGFRPRLSLRLAGSIRHGGYPSLRAVYKPRRDAALSAVSVTLPRSVFLAQEHIDGVCTRTQFNGGDCPGASIYGHARALTPLMDEPLEGPIYLRSSHTAVPDLVADLHGRGIEIEVPGRIDSSRGGIRANFESLPDAPVTSFTLTLYGGKRGLLSNAGAPCRRTHRANARFIAQSNLTAIGHPRLKAKCRAPAHKHGKKRSGARAQG